MLTKEELRKSVFDKINSLTQEDIEKINIGLREAEERESIFDKIDCQEYFNLKISELNSNKYIQKEISELNSNKYIQKEMLQSKLINETAKLDLRKSIYGNEKTERLTKHEMKKMVVAA